MERTDRKKRYIYPIMYGTAADERIVYGEWAMIAAPPILGLIYTISSASRSNDAGTPLLRPAVPL
ncbi:MAG: hypothetical protein ACLRTA_05680 [Clostridia bacterium]